MADPDLASAAALAWLVLGYLALSVGLRLAALLAALLAGRLSGGARWARTGLRLSNLVTIPAVRRLVDGGAAGTLLAASWLPLPAHAGGRGWPRECRGGRAPRPWRGWTLRRHPPRPRPRRRLLRAFSTRSRPATTCGW